MRGEDLTGRKFGRLTVIEFYDRNKYGQPIWLCKCDCGNTSIVCGSALRSGATSSCGCLWRERIVEAKQHTACLVPKFTQNIKI